MAKKKLELDVPYCEKKVLLHTCCAPCSSAIIECLLKHNIEPIIFYCNPNIYPYEEYEIRKKECARYAESLNLKFIEDEYNHIQWLECIKGKENEPERGNRCLECFKYRLLRSAQYASNNNIRVITTTLASSRWKSIDQINEAGEWATKPFEDIIWWNQNWRKGGLNERRAEIIKKYNFYKQQYCGCEFSMRHDIKW